MKHFLENMIKGNPGFSEYLDEALRKDKVFFTRAIIIAGILLYSLFSIVDFYSVKEHLITMFTIRFVVVLFLLFMFYLTYKKEFFLKNYGLIIVSIFLIMGGGIELKLFISNETELAFTTYFAGLMLAILAIFTWTYLNSTVSLVVSITFIAVYIIVVYFLKGDGNGSTFALVVNNVAFLMGAIVIGLLANILFKRYLYRQYIMQSRLRELLLAKVSTATSLNNDFQPLDSLPNLHQYKILLNKQISDANVSNLLLSVNCLQVLSEGNIFQKHNEYTIYEIIVDRLNNILPNSKIFALLDDDKFYFSYLLKRQDNIEMEMKTGLILTLVGKIIKENYASKQMHLCIGHAKFFQNNADTESLIETCNNSLLVQINKRNTEVIKVVNDSNITSLDKFVNKPVN